MRRTSRTEVMKDTQGLDWLEVTFDREDGAIEVVKAFCPISEEYLLVDSDHLPPMTYRKVRQFVDEKVAEIQEDLSYKRTGSEDL